MDIFEYNLCLNAEKKVQIYCSQYLDEISLSKPEKSLITEMLDELPVSRLLRIRKMFSSTKLPQKRRSRQLFRRRNKNKPKPSLPKSAFQMSIMLLTVLAFGTFVTSAIMTNTRKTPRKEAPIRIVINKTPRMEAPSEDVTFNEFAEMFLEGLSDFVNEMYEKYYNYF